MDIQSNSNYPTINQLIPWIMSVLFFIYEFVLRTLVGTFQEQMMYELHMSFLTFSYISTSAFVLVYGVMQVPVGYLLQRFCVKKLLLIMVGISTISTFCFSFCHKTEWFVIVRMLMALGSAFSYVGLLFVISLVFNKNKQGFYIGLSNLIGILGAIFVAGPLSWIANQFSMDWRTLFQIVALIGVILLIAIFFVFPKLENEHKVSDYQIDLSVLKHAWIWILGLYAACIYSSLEYLSENYGQLLLIHRGLSRTDAGFCMSTAWLGYGVGCLLVGQIYNSIKRPILMMQLIAFVGFFVILSIYGIHHRLNALIIYFSIGLICSGSCFAYIYVRSNINQVHVPIAYGFLNAIVALFLSVLSPFIGGHIDLLSNIHQQDYAVVVALSLLMFLPFVFTTILSTFFKRSNAIAA